MVSIKNLKKILLVLFDPRFLSIDELIHFIFIIVQYRIDQWIFDEVLSDLLLGLHNAAISIRLATHLISVSDRARSLLNNLRVITKEVLKLSKIILPQKRI